MIRPDTLEALDADGAALASAATSAQEALDTECAAAAMLRAAWGGRTGWAAADFTDRQCAVAAGIVANLRAAAGTVTGLRDELAQLVAAGSGDAEIAEIAGAYRRAIAALNGHEPARFEVPAVPSRAAPVAPAAPVVPVTPVVPSAPSAPAPLPAASSVPPMPPVPAVPSVPAVTPIPAAFSPPPAPDVPPIAPDRAEPRPLKPKATPKPTPQREPEPEPEAEPEPEPEPLPPEPGSPQPLPPPLAAEAPVPATAEPPPDPRTPCETAADELAQVGE